MAFRDDRDALLARSDALERENERLRDEGAAAAVERDRARKELVEVRARLAALEEQEVARQREARREPRATNRLVPYAVGACVLSAGALAAVVLLSTARSPAHEPAIAVSAPAVTAVANTSAVTAQVERVRLCLDNADLYARVFLGDPAARRKDLTGHVAVCVKSLADAGPPALGDAATAYRDALAAFDPHLRKLFAYHDTGQVEDAPGLAAELEAERGAAEQAWRQASAALRAAARAPYQAERARAAERAATSGQPGIVAFVRFGDAASTFADLLAGDRLDPVAIEAAVEALREARLAAGEHARPEMKRVIDAAEHVRGALAPVTAETTPRERRDARRRVASATLGFACAYNAAQYGRPFPF